MARIERIRMLAAERGFTTVELLIAVFVSSVGIVALVGTLDMSRRVTNLSEMKEAAAHIAEQNMEQIRAIGYQRVALNGTPVASTDPASPAYWVSGGSYTWDHKPGGATEPLVVCTATGDSCPSIGQVSAAPTEWSDGRLKGKVHRFVTDAGSAACPDGSPCRKRVTVAVTVESPGGPKSPIVVSVLLAHPAPVTGSNNPLNAPDTKCIVDGQLTQCAHSIDGKAHTYYLYDTPATSSTRQEISGSHPTRPTVAATGTCGGGNTSGCPIPDLMGVDAPPSGGTAPPLYNYSNEITGGTWPGGAVVRRDTSCDGTPTTTDNTKGHFWVTPPLAASTTLAGQAGVSLSSVTFNGVAASVTLCVRFFDVPGSIANLVSNPPTAIGNLTHTEPAWPRSAAMVGFSGTFRQTSYTIPAGNRLGVRIWPAGSSGADIAAIYDHPDHASSVQVNEAN